MVESFRAGSPLSREGIADALLTTLISIAIKYIPLSPPEYQIQFCHIFDKFTNLSGPVAEQPMPACFQILEILDRLAGAWHSQKKSCNAVQASLGTW